MFVSLRLIADCDKDKNGVVSCIKIIVIDQSGFRPAGGRNATGVKIDFGPALRFHQIQYENKGFYLG